MYKHIYGVNDYNFFLTNRVSFGSVVIATKFGSKDHGLISAIVIESRMEQN
jgi:hypothetical protein